MLQKSRRTKVRETNAEQKMRKLLFVILLFCLCVGVSGWRLQRAKASGASITVDTKSHTVAEGDTVYVVITVSSSDAIGGFEGYFSYDNRVLQFVTGGSVVHGNDDEFQVSDMERDSSATKIKYSIKFRARKKGQTTIALKQPYNVVAADGDAKMSVSYNALDVVVKEPETLQESNPATATPSPKKSAKPKKSTEKQERGKVSSSPSPLPSPSATKISKEDSAHNKVGMGASVEIMELEDESMIPAGFTETEIELDDKKVTAYTLNGEEKPKTVLLYGKIAEKNEEEESQPVFYLYDRESKTLIPYESVRSLYRSMNAKDLVGDSSQRTIQSLKYVIGIMGVFCALMLILAIIFRIRYSSKD